MRLPQTENIQLGRCSINVNRVVAESEFQVVTSGEFGIVFPGNIAGFAKISVGELIWQNVDGIIGLYLYNFQIKIL